MINIARGPYMQPVFLYILLLCKIFSLCDKEEKEKT